MKSQVSTECLEDFTLISGSQLVLTQVDPISQSWKGGRLRYDSAALGLAQVGTSISLDFLVLCLPLPVISTLQMAKKRKIAVGMIFWLGGL